MEKGRNMPAWALKISLKFFQNCWAWLKIRVWAHMRSRSISMSWRQMSSNWRWIFLIGLSKNHFLLFFEQNFSSNFFKHFYNFVVHSLSLCQVLWVLSAWRGWLEGGKSWISRYSWKASKRTCWTWCCSSPSTQHCLKMKVNVSAYWHLMQQ